MPSILAFVLSAFLLLHPPAASTPGVVARNQACVGCGGSGGSASASGGSCGGMVTITVNVQDGLCKILTGEEPGDIQCRQARACVPVVTRTWSGLGGGTPLDFCVEINGESLCLNPKPSSGSGSGADTRPSSGMSCSDDPGDTRSFSISSGSCGLYASAEAKCSACNDAF